jgi:hypothetical protein
VELTQVGGESFLTAHCVGDKIIREAFGDPRILSNREDELYQTPASQRNGKPFGLEIAAQTVNRLIIFRHHYEVINVFDAVQACHALTATIIASLGGKLTGFIER